MSTGSTTQRGYGARHQAEKAKWQRTLDRGNNLRCVCERPECSKHDGRCPIIITASTAWDLGHTDDRTAWTGPECVPCNRSAGGRNGNRVARENAAGFETIDRGWL